MSQVVNTGQAYYGTVSDLRAAGQSVECILGAGRSVLVSRIFGGLIFRGETIEFAQPTGSDAIGTEILVHRAPNSKGKDVYQVPVGYVGKPKEDRRGQFYSLAEVRGSAIGISAVRLDCDVIRDYFYVIRNSCRGQEQPNFYEVLKSDPTASLAELRLAYKLRDLELRTGRADSRELRAIEKAFNILGEPDLRACYDALLKDPETPVPFPYGGFGSLVTEGEQSRDRKTFFARRILAFSPDRCERSFKAHLRRFYFYTDRAVYRDAQRKFELLVDQAAMPLMWEATWNQWKHLLDATVEVQATFLQTRVYRMRNGEWNLVSRERSLPSRIKVTLPADIGERIQAARRRHHIFGQHADFFARLRARIEREPVAKSEIERLFGEVGIPGDFGAEQIIWQAGYGAFYYRKLLKHARKVYLFRDEFIMELERAIAIERPESGYATYLFAKPQRIEHFLSIYTTVTRDDIRRNQRSIAERLGFQGRVEHGTVPLIWLKELNRHLGELAQ
jgi:hypothetical protein